MQTLKHIWDLLPIFAILILLQLLPVGCSSWTYNGINGDDIRNPTWSMAAGAVASMAVHMAGHVAYAQFTGHDWHIEGQSEIIDGKMSDSDGAWFGRAGFLAQIGSGYLFRISGIDNDFTKGWNAAALFEVATYPLFTPVIYGFSKIIESSKVVGFLANLNSC